MMTFEETQALGRVIDHYIHAECDHAQGSGDTSSGHIAHSLMTLDKLRQRLMRDIINSAPPVEEVASRPNGEHPLGQAGPIGIVRDHDLTASEIATSLRISLFGEVSQFSSLPRAILEFAATAQQSGNVMLLEAALAAMRSYKHKLDDDIPF